MDYVAYLMGYAATVMLLACLYIGTRNTTASTVGRIALAVCFLVLVYFRPVFFSDTQAYMHDYDIATWSDLSGFNLLGKDSHTNDEYGFLLALLVFRCTGFSFRMFSCFLSAISIASFYYASLKITSYLTGSAMSLRDYESNKYGRLFISSFALFLVFGGIFYSFVALRSCLSISMIMLASTFLLDKKYGRSLLFVIIAFSFQRLAILGIIPLGVLVIPVKTVSKRHYFIAWIIFAALVVIEFFTHVMIGLLGGLAMTFFNTVMTTGLTPEYDVNDNGSRFLIILGYLFFGLVIYRSYESGESFSRFVIIYLICLALCFVFCSDSASYRIFDYLFVFMVPFGTYMYSKWIVKRSADVWLLLANALFFILGWGWIYVGWALTR